MELKKTLLKRTLSILLAIALLTSIVPALSGGTVQGATPTLATVFPDANFRAYIKKDVLGNTDISDGESYETYRTAIENTTTLTLDSLGIRDLTGVEQFTSLKELSCQGNLLRTLNISGNTALESLACGDNFLSALDTSKNINLQGLSCEENELTKLDFSANPKLVILFCQTNKLTSLNVSKCKSLSMLACSDNQLTQLNLTACPALTLLSCGSNKLKALNLTKNTALEILSCENNQLTQFPLSSANAKLTSLNCSANKLKTIDVSTLVKLESFNCSSNQLTNLSVGKNAALSVLNCNNNQLQTLDISKNTALTQLSCDGNLIRTLNLSAATMLTNLSCKDNLLRTLDLSKNTELLKLNCDDNQLESIDFSYNEKLNDISINKNYLTSYPNKNMECANNRLTTLKIATGDPSPQTPVFVPEQIDGRYVIPCPDIEDSKLIELHDATFERRHFTLPENTTLPAKFNYAYTVPESDTSFMRVYVTAVSQADLDAINAVIAKIDKIPTLTEASRKEIEAASKAYYALTNLQKTLVVNKKTLLAAKDQIGVASNLPGRIAGATRMGTSTAISKVMFDDNEAQAIVLVDGLNFPDALAAVPFAAKKNAPILMVYGKAGKIDETVINEIKRINNDCSAKIYIVGGDSAVTDAVRAQIASMGYYSIMRIPGDTRYDTAIHLAQETNHMPKTAFIVYGNNYPDALGAGSAAVLNDAVILFTQKDKLQKSTAEYIKQGELENIVIVGGTSVINTNVEKELRALCPNVTRVAGADRVLTSVEIAKKYFPVTGTVFVATGLNFADALSGGPLAAKYKAPILLVNSNKNELDPATVSYLKSSGAKEIVILGGENAISPQLEKLLNDAIK